MFQNNMNELSTKGKTLIPSFDFTTATRRGRIGTYFFTWIRSSDY